MRREGPVVSFDTYENVVWKKMQIWRELDGNQKAGFQKREKERSLEKKSKSTKVFVFLIWENLTSN